METSRSEGSTNSFSVSTTSSNKRRAYRTSHAHFYWVTREPESFEWFKGVMNEVAEMDKKVKEVYSLYVCSSSLQCWCADDGNLMLVTRASLSFTTI
jgi:hypothetical protein